MLTKSKLQPVHLRMGEGAAHHPLLNNCLLRHIPPSRQLTSHSLAVTPHPVTRLRSPSCSCTCSRSFILLELTQLLFLSPPSVFVALATRPTTTHVIGHLPGPIREWPDHSTDGCGEDGCDLALCMCGCECGCQGSRDVLLTASTESIWVS